MTCGTFIYEHQAAEMDIPLDHLVTTVEGDLDPSGLAGADVNPRVRAFRVQMALSGPSETDAEALADAFRTHCPIYTTLEASAPIEITTELE